MMRLYSHENTLPVPVKRGILQRVPDSNPIYPRQKIRGFFQPGPWAFPVGISPAVLWIPRWNPCHCRVYYSTQSSFVKGAFFFDCAICLTTSLSLTLATMTFAAGLSPWPGIGV